MPQLAVSVLLHALGGIVLAATVWLAGAALVVRVPRARLEDAYAAGLLLAVLAAFIGLGLSLAPLAVVLLAAAAALGARNVPQEVLRRSARRLATALPGALAFALALGLFQRGPSAERGSNAFGDLVFYVAQIRSAEQSVVPFRDLSVAGLDHTYLQSAPALLGGALAWVPGFDPFLFLAAALPAFLLGALAVGAGVEAGRSSAVLAAVLLAGAFAYPTWLSESPPVALAAPLALAFVASARRPTAVTALLVAAALVLTKGVALAPFLALVALAAGPALVHGARGRVAAIALAAVAAGSAALALLSGSWLVELFTLDFLPADALDGLRAQRAARDTLALAPALLVAGHLLALGGTVRLGSTPLTAAVATGIAAAWFLGGHAADVAVTLPVLAVAFVATRGPLDRTTAALLGCAGALLLGAAWFREVAGIGTGLVLLASLGLAGAGVFAARLTRRAVASLAGAAALVLAAGLVSGTLRLDPASPPLTSEHYDVWHAVAERTPRNALVVTSLTGEQVDGEGGWNYYPAVAGRQLFLAGWANSELRVRPDELRRRLAANRRALAGDAARPLGVDPERPLYAVVRASESAPPGARLLHENARFALYELQDP